MSSAESTDDWDDIGFVISSKYRIAAIKRLCESPATPSKIAEDTDLHVSHVSRALQRLRDRDMVKLLVPEERRKGRVYGITDGGEHVTAAIKEEMSG